MKMKNLKSLVLILFMGLLTFTACENEDVILDDQVQDVTVESESIMAALSAMGSNFDDSGNVDVNSSPAGNIIFDFCFDFVYPITLSYNTGASVTVNDLDGLVNVIISSTDQLFINGIAFPFDVETFDDSTGSVVVQTINNEAEFINLLDNCDFGDVGGGCSCNDVYAPVCVEYTDPNGLVHVISYPNECEALCDGFTQADFLTDCIDNDIFDFGVGCFDLNYPLDLILDDGSTITVNNDTEFGNAMFNQYVVNFVYPITVTLEADGSVVTVNNEIEFETVFTDCFGLPGGPGDGCDQCENEPINPVCVEYTDPSGNLITEVFPNLCLAQCFGYTSADVVDCPDDGGFDCDAQDILDELLDCDTYTGFDTVNGEVVTFEFSLNANSVDIFAGDGSLLESYGFTIEDNTAASPTYISFTANADDPWSSDWIYNCNDDGPEFFTPDQSIVNIDDDCD